MALMGIDRNDRLGVGVQQQYVPIIKSQTWPYKLKVFLSLEHFLRIKKIAR